MSKQSRQKTIHYKRAAISHCSSDLQSILESIISIDGTVPKVGMRREQISASNTQSSYRVINKSNTFKTILFGELILFEKGRSQALMTISEDVPFYDINAITSEQIKLEADGKISEEDKLKIKREFIDSILYFGVLDNHVMVVQSSSLRTKDLENHLNWLIHSFGNSFTADSILILKDKPTEETIKKLEKTPVKKINLGSVPVKSKTDDGSIKITSITNPENGNRIQKVRKMKFLPVGRGGSILKAAFGEEWFSDLKLEDSLDESNLQINLEITYLRKTNDDGQLLMDTLATSIRNMDDEDVEIHLQGGGTLKGGDLRLSGTVSVEYNNGLIDENHLYLQMHKWLHAKIGAGEINSK
ncbi:hypothetical protein SNN68_003834 [Cronobacter sakazakii]|uniref:hypothetical protein n=1 Tax=Cronobacter sakazakii TaxID=28141 RepID=UPI000A192484|nr:hypothetical protein [Cronobacter sakazakii]EKM5761705.1 hypothetical protein [Cronobacter turicensis]EGZ6858253.1 hypothetical protein [Cronobacter sakazakii]EGZ6870063.1 hypothetical protein [Cronobacter sakazakii]ELY2684382.1 hypothetical protein [Cronobacter sakazakii]ELY5911656.1 hypothetical protein [Cronobacter sakazakii]